MKRVQCLPMTMVLRQKGQVANPSLSAAAVWQCILTLEHAKSPEGFSDVRSVNEVIMTCKCPENFPCSFTKPLSESSLYLGARLQDRSVEVRSIHHANVDLKALETGLLSCEAPRIGSKGSLQVPQAMP